MDISGNATQIVYIQENAVDVESQMCIHDGKLKYLCLRQFIRG